MSAEYGISLTSTIQRLADLGIPMPDVTSPEYPVYLEAGDGHTKPLGFPFVTWHWDTISRAALWRILRLLGSAKSAVVYIRTKTITAAGPTWQTYSGILKAPNLSGQDGTMVGQNVDVFTNVTIRIARLIAI